MDKDLNPENSISSAKRSKLDNGENETVKENDSNSSSSNDKFSEKLISMDAVPNNSGNSEEIAKNDIETSKDNADITDISKNFVTKNKKDKENNSTSELPKGNDNKVNDEQSTINEIVQNEKNVENDGNNHPSTSNQKEEEKNEEKNDTDDSNAAAGSSSTKTPITKRRNYRTRVVSYSSSSDSDSDDDQETTAAGASLPTAAGLRKKRLNLFLSSSSESEPNPHSARNDDDTESTSTSITYPDFDAMDYDDSNSSSSNKEDESNIAEEILQSQRKPDYNWNSAYEIMYREHGLSGKGRYAMAENGPYSFQTRFYSSRHIIEKMKLLHKLEKHQGCVNSLNFNKSGSLLASGSDDLKIILWNWASNKIVHAFKSGHTSNVFQTKFIDLPSGINIVSSGRDGQVRHATIVPSGGKVISAVILKHEGAVHKISPTPQNPYEVLTAGEDGHVVRFDVRERPVERIVTVKANKRKVPLYSIAHHPFEPEFCVCGRDQYVYVYDKRNTKTPIELMCPRHLEDKKTSISYITCALYNYNGTEILASYSDEDIYLFNNRCYLNGMFAHKYRGHNNRKTIKGVNFFGLHSEYIVSGSDCGNFFIWDKETESIVNWIHGDRGVVNCLEPHPSFPVLATSGLDPDVKIWVPLKDQYPPPMDGLEKCIKHNTKRSVMSNNDIFDNRTLLFFVHRCLRSRRAAQNDDNCPNVQDLVSSSSSDDEEPCADDDNIHLGSLPCSPQ